MQTVEVKLQRDHLERLATSQSPVSAVAELIWNSLDADATRVEVALDQNPMGGIESLRVLDNGHGLPHRDAVPSFERLGGSWKRTKNHSMGGRMFHGLQGKGRFQAFALGTDVEWLTRYEQNGDVFEYRIRGSRQTLQRFTIEDPEESTSQETGTVATILGVDRPLSFLKTSRAIQSLTEEFALYLRQYSGIHIIYDNEALDPSSVEDHVQDYSLEPVILEDGSEVKAELTVVEWTVKTERSLFLCDRNGFTLHRLPAGIHAPGFTFTAYLKSPFIRDLWESGDLKLAELHSGLRDVVDAAKRQLRDHFRHRSAEKAGDLVEEWKSEKVYPYEGSPRSVVEEAERQVFEVLALNVHAFLPDFGGTSRENRKLSFRLLKNAIETSPEAVQTILNDVLSLPEEKQNELAELLERTSLEAIINASKVVADRLDFLLGLELLVFDPKVRKRTLERRHLHKIVAEHTWLFGEEFNLTASDRSLTNVLKRHLDLSRVEVLDDKPVLREDDTEGIIDLMFSRLVPQPHTDRNEHLIVELKRPTVAIGSAEVTQVKEYAVAIAKDERFRDTQTRWEFWAVSNDMSESVRFEANQAGRPQGLLLHLDDFNLKIWVKTWGQIIEGCRARLRFFQERLNYVADDESGLGYLRRVHEKYLPKVLTESENGSRDEPD